LSPVPVEKRPLWTCPRCGKRFVGKNMWHSCSRRTVDEFFAGRDPALRRLFDAYVDFVEQIGPFTIDVAKTRIAFQVRVRFAGVARLRRNDLVAGFWLKRRIESPRFTRVELIPPGNWVYQFVIRSPDDLDSEARRWLEEAYRVGQQTPRR
jgi:hypothetical protein